eukprot:CAMPEP_0198140672 /NCGR_PEP_ID=MMETSP1443-20131203/3803_1 /TAXON_ID=186043 /ORGANISM="Entomoneis sp., Strain CCMP2396" /LENGTH=388 /DNA_ID=CAMNT_0043803177 /DNA_START=94 /DNA_END=1260 /DNA_ORIENTATION=+
MVRTLDPPGPLLQRLNTLIHKEPFSSVSHALYWSTVFLVAVPVVIFYFQIYTIWTLALYFTGLGGDSCYDPQKKSSGKNKQQQQQELAVVISGCDSGFGKELAIVSAQEGFVVFAGCLQESSFAQFDFSSNIHPLKLDVTKDEDVAQVVNKVEEWLMDEKSTTKQRFLHALCNNAGIGNFGAADWVDIATYQKIMDVNFFGVVRCCKGFLPLFKKQAVERIHKGARIFNVSSMAGLVKAANRTSPYAASKHATVAFSSSLRQELQAFGIQVCTVCPSFHGTPLVENIHNTMRADWESMPKEKQEEYGQEFLDHSMQLADDAHKFTWHMDNVIQELLKGLKGRSVPAEMIIGFDSRFVFLLISMLPSWIVDLIYQINAGTQPIPCIMRK